MNFDAMPLAANTSYLETYTAAASLLLRIVTGLRHGQHP